MFAEIAPASRSNYTTLKQAAIEALNGAGFRPLQNYTTLKPQIEAEGVVEEYSTYIV